MQSAAIGPEEAMKGHRPLRLSSAQLVRLLSEVYVEAALSISARINLVYVPFFIIGELSVRMQLAEWAIEQQLEGIALFKRSIGSLMECLRENLEFETWMYVTTRKSSEQSRIGKAIKYTLPLMPRLGRYVNDGRFCIDNNLVENAVRPLALGRKNFLFCGNHDAAVRAAIVYSLVSSCKAMGVDPREWMEDVMLRIPGNESNRDVLRRLLPDRWAKQTN